MCVCGTSNDMNVSIGLLELADCYCESDLKQHCEQILTDYITVENVIQFYTLAVHHQAKVRIYILIHIYILQ